MPDIMTSVNGNFQVSAQSAAFRRSVAERMAAYEDRIADRIRQQMDRHGEDPADLAYKLGLNPRTPERWINEGVVPQPRQFRALSKHWGIPVAELKPDLEKEEEELSAQLQRIEEKLDEVLRRLPPVKDEPGEGGDHGQTEPARPGPTPPPRTPDPDEPQTEEEEPKRSASD